MKKLILTLVIALMSISAMAQTEGIYASYIQISGRAEMEVIPNEVYLSIVIDEQDSKGKLSIEDQQRKMVASLKKLGIDVDKNLTVMNMMSEAFKRRDAVTSANYELMVSKPAMVGKVYNALNELDITKINVDRITHSDLDEYSDQLRVKALKNAKTKAAEMAEAIGQTIGKCFYIYDSNNRPRPMYQNMAEMTRMGASANSGGASNSENLDFKKIALEASVSTKFILE